jgi:hypothetical protein
MRPPKSVGESAGDLFGIALGVLLDDTVSPEILHQLVDLAVALRDHERARVVGGEQPVRASSDESQQPRDDPATPEDQ